MPLFRIIPLHLTTSHRFPDFTTLGAVPMMLFIRKQAYMVDYTVSSLMRRKGKNLGLLLVYAMIVFMLASVMLFTHALRQEAETILQQSPEIIVQRTVAGRHA